MSFRPDQRVRIVNIPRALPIVGGLNGTIAVVVDGPKLCPCGDLTHPPAYLVRTEASAMQLMLSESYLEPIDDQDGWQQLQKTLHYTPPARVVA